MMAYQEVVRSLLEKIKQVHVELIPRNLTLHTNALARLAILEGPVDMKDITITKLSHLSTSYSLVAALDTMDLDEDMWMTPIIRHIKSGELLADRVQARQ